MFFGTIRSIKIGNFDEWAVDGRGSQRIFKEIHKHFIATIINSFGFSFVYFNFSLIYQHDFQQPRYFRPIIQLLRWDRVWMFMCMRITNIFLSVVYLFSTFCLIFLKGTDCGRYKKILQKCRWWKIKIVNHELFSVAKSFRKQSF